MRKSVAFEGCLGKFSAKENVLFCGKGGFFSSCKATWRRKVFWLPKKPAFSTHARPTDKEKPFFSTAKFQFRTAPKLTRSHKFYPRKLTVSLQYNNPFSRVRNLASDVRLPFRTDSNPHRRYPERLQFPAQPVT